MHSQVRDDEMKNGLKFWFQTGTKDEPFDRNGNGVIDSIDDTLDLIAELTKKVIDRFMILCIMKYIMASITQHTWAQALPHFEMEAFGAN